MIVEVPSVLYQIEFKDGLPASVQLTFSDFQFRDEY